MGQRRYTYTNAGRETARTDTQPSGATFGTTTQAYNSYGQRNALALPEGSYSDGTYDVEGNYTGDSYEGLSYSIRGELTNKTAISTFECAGGCMQRELNQAGANGMMVQKGLGASTKRFDERVSVPLDQVNPQATPAPTGPVCTPSKTDPTCMPATSTTREYVWTYDAAGRETNKKTTTTKTTRTYSGLTTSTYTQNAPQSYDAENRVLSDNVTSYSWGPNGHPLTVSSATWHWDGDDVLFVTDASGRVTDLKVESMADVQPQSTNFAGLTMYDRNPEGSIAATRNINTSTELDVQDPYEINFKCGSPLAPLEARTDGVTGSCNATIQGVRAYDSDSQTWTTPDAYQGDVHDPMSLKSYMWNDNNPISYSDPSGYAPGEEEEEQSGTPSETDRLMENTKIGSWQQRETIAIGQQVGKQAGIPAEWEVNSNLRSGKVTFTQPGTRGGTQIRIMPGNPKSPFANSRVPYVRVVINGESVDENGKPVNKQSGAAHISIKNFKFNKVIRR